MQLEVGTLKLGFADNLNLIGNNQITVVKDTATLIDKAKTVNEEKNQSNRIIKE